MSRIKISEDLFLEKQELNRMLRFLAQDGHKREFLLNTQSFGIVSGERLPNSTILPKDSLLVENANDNLNNILVRPGKAVDKDGNIISLLSTRTINIPNDSQWYWIKASFVENLNEEGVVNVDAQGVLTGVGTKFTDVLRGKPNFTSKIKLIGSASGNDFEYDVIEVTSDTSCVLGGTFTAETNLKYTVLGTFTPGFVPSALNKSIFVYDDCQLVLVVEAVSNTAPPKTTDSEFYLARVKADGLNCLVEDKREEFWRTKVGSEIKTLDRNIVNPIIGVESVKWDIESETRQKNEVIVSWGYRSSNWTIDPTQHKVTTSIGVGGRLKQGSVAEFTNGDFDGWRIYTKNGNYGIIYQSTKSGSQINLLIDYLNPDDYVATEEIVIVPDVEMIEIKSNYNNAVGIREQLTETFEFPINKGFAKIYLRCVGADSYYLYNLKFRYRNYKEYTDFKNFPIIQSWHYTEKAFLVDGTISPVVTGNLYATNVSGGYIWEYTPHNTNGFVKIVPNSGNYENTIARIDLGDLLGVETYPIATGTAYKELVVGQTRQYQYYEGAEITLVQDLFISLNKFFDPGINTKPCKNGNFFMLHFKQKISFTNYGTFKLYITDYDGVSVHTVLKEFTIEDLTFLKDSPEGIFIRATYDGTKWILNSVNEPKEKQGSVKMFYPLAGGVVNDYFDVSTGLGRTTKGWGGWALCDGKVHGGLTTPDMRSKFVVGFHSSVGDDGGDYKTAGETGPPAATLPNTYDLISGGKGIKLGRFALPPHRHKYFDGFLNTNTGSFYASKLYEDHADDLGVLYDPAQQGVSPHDPYINEGAGAGDNRFAAWSDRNSGDGTDNVGGQDALLGTVIENRPPYITLAYIIKL